MPNCLTLCPIIIDLSGVTNATKYLNVWFKNEDNYFSNFQIFTMRHSSQAPCVLKVKDYTLLKCKTTCLK